MIHFVDFYFNDQFLHFFRGQIEYLDSLLDFKI